MRALTITVVLLLLPLSGFAAGPRVILVHGAPLTKPVVMDDFQENLDLLHATANDAGISSSALANRAYLEVELFAGPYWVEYMKVQKTGEALRPESAEQHARFYPAAEGQPAIMAYEVGLPRRVAPNGLAILQRNGIPVSFQSGQSSTATLCVLAAISFLIVFAAWRVNKYSGQQLKED